MLTSIRLKISEHRILTLKVSVFTLLCYSCRQEFWNNPRKCETALFTSLVYFASFQTPLVCSLSSKLDFCVLLSKPYLYER